jgi:hypothetical protein
VAELPLAEAVGFPAAEVLGGDGLGAETGFERAFDRREGIEPGKDGGGGLVVEEPAVEGLADGFGQTGDFTDHSLYLHASLYHGIFCFQAAGWIYFRKYLRFVQ